jgi:hypothetical protein
MQVGSRVLARLDVVGLGACCVGSFVPQTLCAFAGGGTVAYDQIKTERYIMAALNARLSDKGCPAIDIEQAIAGNITTAAAKPCAAAGKCT